MTATSNGRTDWVGPICIFMLGIIGLFFIESASSGGSVNYWSRQLVWFAVGGTVYVILSLIDYKIYLENALWIFLIGVFLLLLIETPLGMEREGAKRWLDFKIMAYQPSEAAKVATLIMIASILARSEVGDLGASKVVVVKVFIVTVIPMFLIFKQPDLGSSLIIPPMVMTLLYISKLSARFFLVVLGVFILGSAVLTVDLYRYSRFLENEQLTAIQAREQYQVTSWLPLKDYQRERIMTFVAPNVVDPRGTGSAWNANQAQQAVGSGGLHGKGWGQGQQARLGYLPRTIAHNDFIFAVIAEEKGFIGGVSVIGIYALLLANGVRIAGIARDRFGMLLASGITIIFLIHVFINIGMSVGLTPITGLPLPFISYGGSFILSCCVLQGILQSVNRHRRDFA